MKKHFLWLLPLMLLLATGCPIGLDYPLGDIGQEKIDKELIGTWVNSSSEAEVQRVTIDKGDENSYAITVQERGEMYALETDQLTGWVTSVKGRNFVFFRPEGEEKYYHYCYWFEGTSTLHTCDVALLDGGVDAVTDTKSLREQVASSMEKDAWGDETQEWGRVK
jgi:hypothetical protein